MSSKKCCPAPAGDPIQRATSTRITCPWANSATSPSTAAGPGYHTVHPRTHLAGRLPVRASVSEDQPARCRLVDLLRRQTLVLAVIPLDQVAVDNDRVTETDQFASLARPLHRAAEDERNDLPASTGQILSASRLPFSVNGISVVPVCCPLRLHCVSPCLIAKTFTFASSNVRRCPPRSIEPLRTPLPAPTSSR